MKSSGVISFFDAQLANASENMSARAITENFFIGPPDKEQFNEPYRPFFDLSRIIIVAPGIVQYSFCYGCIAVMNHGREQ